MDFCKTMNLYLKMRHDRRITNILVILVDLDGSEPCAMIGDSTRFTFLRLRFLCFISFLILLKF